MFFEKNSAQQKNVIDKPFAFLYNEKKKGMGTGMVSRRKKCLSLILAVWMFSCCLLSFAAAAEQEDPNVFSYRGRTYRRSEDVPAVHISVSGDIHTSYYVSCSVVAIDRVGGTYRSVVDEDATIRIRGNSTSSGAKKPYNIKFGTNTDLFGMGKGKRYCLIANLFDPTLLRNQMVFDFAKEIGMLYTPDSMLADVYLNGKYLGCYQLCEAITTGKDRVAIDTDNGDFILERDERTDAGATYFYSPLGIRFGIREPDVVTNKTLADIQRKVSDAESALQSGDYERVKQYFDISSMVDSYICLEYFKNVDIDCASTRFFYRDGKFYGGPVWDYDLSSGNCSSDYYHEYNNYGNDSVSGIYCERLWYGPLLQYNEFYQALRSRYLQLQDQIANLYEDNVLGKNYLDRMTQAASKSLKRNFAEAGWDVWRVYAPYMRVPNSSYQSNLEFLRNWLRDRNTWLLNKWGLTTYRYPKPNSDAGLSVVDGFLTGFSPYTSADELQAMFNRTVHPSMQGDYLATGDSIRTQGASRYVVVNGDLNGDGKIKATDYVLLKRMLAGDTEVSRAVYLAACMGQSEPSADGCELIRKYCTEGSVFW